MEQTLARHREGDVEGALGSAREVVRQRPDMTAAPLSPLTLLAHHADGTAPPLAPGVHLRWFSAPPLGLSVDVFEVERADASEAREFQVDQVNWFGRFGGLSVPEIAGSLGVSEVTVMRDWRVARAWLTSALGGG